MTQSELSVHDSPHSPAYRGVAPALVFVKFTATISSSVVAAALPTITRDLGANSVGYTWIAIATLITATSSLPLWGQAADRLRLDWLLGGAMAWYVSTAIMCAVAPTATTLVAARAAQGLAVGGLTAVSLTAMTVAVRPEHRRRYFGHLASAFALGTIVGPLLGGLITAYAGWRWCFLVPVPVGIAAAVVVLVRLQGVRVQVSNERVKYDLVGTALLSLGVAGLLAWVSVGWNDGGWQLLLSFGGLLGSIFAVVAAGYVGRFRARPALPVNAFTGDGAVPLAALAGLSACSFGLSVHLAELLTAQYALTPSQVGSAYTPLVLGFIGAASMFGRIKANERVDRWSVRAGGLLLVTALAVLSAPPSLGLLLVALVASGVSVGILTPFFLLAYQQTLPRDGTGTGSALSSLVRNLAGAVGVASVGAIVSLAGSDVSRGFLILLVPALLVALVAAGHRHKRPTVGPDPR